jgi:galactose mutarotase-like enzyme
MRIGKISYGRSELLRRVGHEAQLAGTRHYTLSEGRAAGVRAIDFDPASGLTFTVLPDRGLDISRASYRGVNLVYLTPNGEVHPAYYDPQGAEWLRIFFGGLLTTCGLTYFGAPGRDGEEDLGLHGRYAATPAVRVNDLSRWEGDELRLEVRGTVEEAVLFGCKLRLERSISTASGRRSLLIEDRVTNFGYERAPFTILYHINAGFPLLDEGAYLAIAAREVAPYTPNAEAGLAEHRRFGAPVPGCREQNFLHTLAADREGFGHAALVNRNLDLALRLKVRADTLPYISEWKMMGEGDYVVGIEPCNTQILNRGELRRRGMLPFLEPGESREMAVEIGVLDGAKEIDAFERMVEKMRGT